MPLTRSRPHRAARRAGLVAAACLLVVAAMPPATASEVVVVAAAQPGTQPGTQPGAVRVSAAPDVRVEVGGPLDSLVAPVAPVDAPSADRWEAVGAAASARLLAAGLDPATVGYAVDYQPGRAGLRGLTIPSERRIEMYVRADHDVEDVLRVLVHELGHAVSETCLDDVDRARYAAVRGLRVGWYPAAHGGASGTEDHAEVFAWAVLGGLADMQATGAGAPGGDELEALRAEGLLSTC